MFILGTLDVILNLVNFVYLSSDELNYGLVIGPPTRNLWTSLCVFTVFGTLLYIPETINTFSVLYRLRALMVVSSFPSDRRTRIRILRPGRHQWRTEDFILEWYKFN